MIIHCPLEKVVQCSWWPVHYFVGERPDGCRYLYQAVPLSLPWWSLWPRRDGHHQAVCAQKRHGICRARRVKSSSATAWFMGSLLKIHGALKLVRTGCHWWFLTLKCFYVQTIPSGMMALTCAYFWHRASPPLRPAVEVLVVHSFTDLWLANAVLWPLESCSCTVNLGCQRMAAQKTWCSEIIFCIWFSGSNMSSPHRPFPPRAMRLQVCEWVGATEMEPVVDWATGTGSSSIVVLAIAPTCSFTTAHELPSFIHH